MGKLTEVVERYAHIVSFAVVHWVDLFTRADYAEFVLKNLD